MRVVLQGSSRSGNVFKTLDATALLDVVREVATCAIFHNEEYVPFGTLRDDV